MADGAWWDQRFSALYSSMQDWRSTAYRASMLNALRLQWEVFPMGFGEWTTLIRENRIWDASGNWDERVFAAFDGRATEYSPPEVAVVMQPKDVPPILMERQRDEVLCSIHSLNNLLQARIANPAMFANMENAFNVDGSLQQCDSEHVIRVARTLGISLVGVTLVGLGTGEAASVQDMQQLKGDDMLERFLQSCGGFIALRQGVVSARNPVGSGHYVAVLYGGPRYRHSWILLNSLSTEAVLYTTAYDALFQFQQGVTGNISIYFPVIPHLAADGTVSHGVNELKDVHFRLLRLQLLSVTDISVEAWRATMLNRHGISTFQLNSAFTYEQFPVRRSMQTLLHRSPDSLRTITDVENLRIDWWSNYNGAVLGVLGASSLQNFQFFGWTLLFAHASTSESKDEFNALASQARVSTPTVYLQLYGLAYTLFRSLERAGNLSLMNGQFNMDQLRRGLSVSLQPEAVQLLHVFPQPDITPADVVQQLLNSLSSARDSLPYKRFLLSLGNALSVFVPKWLVETQQRVYGFETALFKPDMDVDVSGAASVDEAARRVVDQYRSSVLPRAAAHKPERLFHLTSRLWTELIDRKSSIVNSSAERNALIRTGLPPESLDGSDVPTATPFWKLLNTHPSGLNSFPV